MIWRLHWVDWGGVRHAREFGSLAELEAHRCAIVDHCAARPPVLGPEIPTGSPVARAWARAYGEWRWSHPAGDLGAQVDSLEVERVAQADPQMALPL